MNRIAEDQVTQKQLNRLAAQRQLYSEAKNIQALQLTLTVPVVILLSFVVAAYPNLKMLSVVCGLVITLLDVAVFVPWQRARKSTAAKIQELFDCDVLHMEWLPFKHGAMPAPEIVQEAADRYRRKDPSLATVKNWYPPVVTSLPLEWARLICQRMNTWWDAKLRQRYSAWIFVMLIALTITVLLFGLVGGMTLEKFLLTVVAPLTPAFVLGIRQSNENNDAVESLERIRGHVEGLWVNALQNNIKGHELDVASRQLQDEILNQRRSSPLIFDWVYRLLIREQDSRMNKSAAELVEEASKVAL